jgi:hypothetical protein
VLPRRALINLDKPHLHGYKETKPIELMKTSLLTVAFVSASLSAFAQGKIALVNDSLHLAYFCPDADSGLSPLDVSLAGQGVTSSPTASGMIMVASLYAGTSSSSLSLRTTTTFNIAAPGRISPAFVTLSDIPGGVTAFFEVVVHDINSPDPLGGSFTGYIGFSGIFTAVTGSSIAYNSIVNPTPPVNSTWENGDFDMSAQTGIAGALGAIHVGYLECIPEPSTFALMGFAAAGLLFCRSSKRASIR